MSVSGESFIRIAPEVLLPVGIALGIGGLLWARRPARKLRESAFGDVVWATAGAVIAVVVGSVCFGDWDLVSSDGSRAMWRADYSQGSRVLVCESTELGAGVTRWDVEFVRQVDFESPGLPVFVPSTDRTGIFAAGPEATRAAVAVVDSRFIGMCDESGRWSVRRAGSLFMLIPPGARGGEELADVLDAEVSAARERSERDQRIDLGDRFVPPSDAELSDALRSDSEWVRAVSRRLVHTGGRGLYPLSHQVIDSIGE